MESNPVCHPSPAKKIKCLFLDYVQLLMIGRTGQWAWTLSATLLQWKIKMLIFGLRSTSDDQPGWSMDSKTICHPSPAKKKMLIFGLCSTSDDWPGWSMDLNPIHHSSPAWKIKCLFLDYVQLLMISRAGRWTRTPSATPLQPKKLNAYFWIIFNHWWLTRLVRHPSPAKKIKCSFLDYVQLLMIGQAGRWTWTPSTTPLQPEK